MKVRNLRAALAAGTAMVLLGLSPAMAQTGAPQTAMPADDDAFQEVVVTARKRAESLTETPTAISAFTAEDIQQRNMDNLADVGKYVPNLEINRFGVGNPAHAAIFIRGIGLQDHIITTDPAVGVYVDGVYLGRQMGSNLRPDQYRAGGGAARPPGHAVRQEHHRRRRQHHHRPTGR
ncbi:MAG: Plug domain-containing protein [Azospirillaceae bacterium]|nr:Plug domain-containing protein [Azospirillaceae bacterium]